MFKIGDFSRLTRVSVRMLRHYDELGILKPEATDDFTGYRFYSIEQIPKVNRIQVLREMGFSLSEISGLMEQDLGSKQLLSLLDNRKRAISETIEKEQEKLLRVENLIKFIHREDSRMNYDITIKSIPSYKVIAVRDIIPTYEGEGKLWDELCAFAGKNNIKAIGPSYAIYYDTGYKESDVDVEVVMTISGDIAETVRVKVKELEAVDEMAVVFHKGHFHEMTSAYRALAIWLSANEYEMNGPIRAIYHKGPWSEQNPEEYLTEIQAPVVKKK
ncbi:MerR family transcriptional regulator [Clostridium cellulovorans]|uniref:Transcriptional activator ligand binding domain protein n=1 Tax=Clostridium cellulovorans (strain ATCC 35296 / DSM 3052 / OCM 3 / 743B) TaxID=573061 RepID=D9SQH2_CLOC7|nr:MerR family transcriptional regulator [Clostridium cellulovorans]ADL50240.1 transcriptional activator ligand binding domain protein [Clostridium cellulovorans 743B]